MQRGRHRFCLGPAGSLGNLPIVNIPTEEIVARAHQHLADWQTESLETYRELLRIPSLESEAQPNAPFGAENRRALDFMLALSEKTGLKTKDMDGYCAYAEYGQGEKMVMSLGHLDVVPVGPGWKHAPFGAELDGGYVYARGAGDDKGPTMAMFYAAKAVKEAWPDIPVRVRQVFGCNEESGFACVHHYVEHEEAPTLGVAPDAMWPLVHAEKGIANLILRRGPIGTKLRLTSLTGGQRPNIVIDHAVATVEVDLEDRGPWGLVVNEAWDRNIEYTWDHNTLTLVARGKAAHGSTPFMGDNAVTRILRFLKEIAPVADQEAYEKMLSVCHPGGNGLGIAGADDLTVLTANVGIVRMVDGEFEFTVNVRYPVTWTGDQLKAKCLAGLPAGWRLADFEDSAPLYFPVDHPLVSSIVDAYFDETGERLLPETMGGGTYARAVPNCVAIGTGWRGDGPAHETDERMAVESFHRMARIYVRVLVNLVLAAQGLAPSVAG